MTFAQSPDAAFEALASSGILGALVVILLFTSGYLLKLLLKSKDDRIDDKENTLVKQFEVQTSTKQVLDRVLDELRSK